MNIIHLILGKANPERMNGVNKVVYQLARHQQAAGAMVSVWGLAWDTNHNYPRRNFSTVLFQRQRWGMPLGLKAAIKALPKDTVVHFHGVFIPILDRVALLLAKEGIAYIVTPHGSLSKAAMEKNGRFKQHYFQWITKRVLRQASTVQMLGEVESSDLFERAPALHQVLIPNGHDAAQIPVDLEIPVNKHPLFGFCGRLDRYHKGLDLMLSSFQQLLQKEPHARLALIGDGKDRENLENQCRALGITENVIFYGARFGAEKYALLAQCDFFLHTSRMEGFPMAVLEAAALGIPCLTTRPTSMNRYLETYEAGLPIQDLQVSSISARMLKAASLFYTNNLTQMKANARKMIATEFNWNDIAGQLIRVYQKSLA